MLLYQIIKDQLTELSQGQKHPGKLPAERHLQERFNSTRITVREALMRLEAEGLIYRQNRIGWFLSPARLLWDPIEKADFYQLAKDQGFSARTELLTLNKTKVSEQIMRAFGCNANSHFYEIYRVRYLNERPVMLEKMYCLAKQFPKLADKPLNGSITKIFANDYQQNITSEQSQILVTALPSDKAEQLNLNGGAACLKIIRKRYDETNTLVDYNIEYWSHSAIEMRVKSH